MKFFPPDFIMRPREVGIYLLDILLVYRCGEDSVFLIFMENHPTLFSLLMLLFNGASCPQHIV